MSHPPGLRFSSNTYYNGRWEPSRERRLPLALGNLLGWVILSEAISVRLAAVHLSAQVVHRDLAKSHIAKCALCAHHPLCIWCFFVKAGKLQVEAFAQVFATAYLLNVKRYACDVLA